MLSEFRDGGAFVSTFAGNSEWERHTNGDELVFAVEGNTDLILFVKGEEVRTTLNEGSLFVIPKNTWHRFETNGVKLLTLTPQPTDHYTGDVPDDTERVRSKDYFADYRSTLLALAICICTWLCTPPIWAQTATAPEYPVYPQRVFAEYFLAEDMDDDEKEVLARHRESSLEYVPESAFVVGIYPDLLSEYREADLNAPRANQPVPHELVLSELDMQVQTERRIVLTANSAQVSVSDDHLRWIGESAEGDVLTLHQLVLEDHFGPFWGQLQTNTASYRVIPIPCDPFRYFYYRLPQKEEFIPSDGAIYSFLTTRQDCWPAFSNGERNELRQNLADLADFLRTMPENERRMLMDGQQMRCVNPDSTYSIEDWRKTMACEAEQKRTGRIAGRRFTFSDRPVFISPEATALAEKNGAVRATLLLDSPILDGSVYPQKRLKKSDIRQRRMEALMQARVRYSALGSKFVSYSGFHRRLTMDFTKAALEAAKSDLEVRSIHGPPQKANAPGRLSN